MLKFWNTLTLHWVSMFIFLTLKTLNQNQCQCRCRPLNKTSLLIPSADSVTVTGVPPRPHQCSHLFAVFKHKYLSPDCNHQNRNTSHWVNICTWILSWRLAPPSGWPFLLQIGNQPSSGCPSCKSVSEKVFLYNLIQTKITRDWLQSDL